MEFNKPKKKKVWHTQQEKILKVWGEQSACYRFMHFKAYQKYKKLSLRFTLPIIIISTVTGTANFAQNTFPVAWRPLVPSGIGAFNLVAAIMTTILQFLKINELMESHRVSSVHYGKLSRSVRLQLTLPRDERSQDGSVFVEYCNQEYDRLIEQSPSIPDKIIKLFEKEFPIIKHKKNPEDQQRTCCLDIQQYCCTSFNDEIDEKDLNLERPEIIKLTPIKPFGFSDGTTRSDSAQTVNIGTAAAVAPDPRPRFKSYPSLPLDAGTLSPPVYEPPQMVKLIEKTKNLPLTTLVEPELEMGAAPTPSPASLADSEEVVVNVEELKQKFNQSNS